MKNNNYHEKAVKGVKFFSCLSIFLCWAFVFPEIWINGIILTLFTLLGFTFTDFFLRKTTLGYSYHFALFTLGVLYTLLLLSTSFHLFQKINMPGQYLLFFGVLIVFGSLLSIFSSQKIFSRLMEKNVELGRLNKVTAEWYPAAPLIMSSNDKVDSKNNFVVIRRLLGPFSIAFAFYVARNLDGNFEIFYKGVLLFLLGSLLLWSISYQFAVGLVLRDWEKQLGRKIVLNWNSK